MIACKRPWRAQGFLIIDGDGDSVVSAYGSPLSRSQAFELIEFIAEAVNSYEGKLPNWMENGHLCELPISDSDAG
jgi:hypothetical protein